MKAILVVDDEKITLKLIAEIISQLGYYPILATDGERAQSVLEDNPKIAGILTDYQMPNVDGLEFLTDIRLNDKFKSLPIMVFSAYISLREISAVLDKGAHAFMPKPIAKRNIQDFLETYVGLD